MGRQVIEIDGGSIRIGVRRLREIVQIVDDAHVPIEDVAEDFHSHGFADSLSVARKMPVVRQGIEHGTRGSDWTQIVSDKCVDQ